MQKVHYALVEISAENQAINHAIGVEDVKVNFFSYSGAMIYDILERKTFFNNILHYYQDGGKFSNISVNSDFSTIVFYAENGGGLVFFEDTEDCVTNKAYVIDRAQRIFRNFR